VCAWVEHEDCGNGFQCAASCFLYRNWDANFLLTPWNRVLLEKLTIFQLLKKFPAFYRTRRFITAFTSASHLSRTKISVQVRGFLCEYFVTRYFLGWGGVSNSPNPQAGGPPLVGCPRLLIQYIRSYPPHWRTFLHPQPEDVPCRGDRVLTFVLIFYEYSEI
jgi:hypothetical protein